MLRVVRGVAAIGLAVGSVLLFLISWQAALTSAGYRGDPGTYQIERCTTQSTPDGDVHRCTGTFSPADSTAAVGTPSLAPARELHPPGTRLDVRRVGDQVFLPSQTIAAVSFPLLVAVAAFVLGLALHLGSLTIADDDWRLGTAAMWSLTTSAIAAALGVLGVLGVLVFG
ncbi:hypothetical protein [Actinokineospora terrae]|uniref:Uncharacterized protein n=1 Tax=Actinokineospora terrae TaxID=155974 RepID=A0A1H9KEJ5_9PSEU|nr:hypothetical protein [Actinokineospora terrae]SEQ97355.1 hypothetical protein SAMN04487818_101138 [Actinokineospora terrae]